MSPFVPPDSEKEIVTRRDLALELRSFRNEVRVLVALAVIVSNFSLPTEATAAAVIVVLGKAAFSFLRL